VSLEPSVASLDRPAGTRASAAARTISRTCFSAIVPGLMRMAAAPASIAAKASRQS